ncbi:MAG: ATP-binding protein [Candidatus Marinimicrobia bacterium]|nr:ATP-binding protein [Candidatus Neomarinimicrobiota bacterium]
MDSFVKRSRLLEITNTALSRSVIVSILGPRQCGKTTLAKIIAEKIECLPGRQTGEYFDLEHPAALSRLANPLLTLESLEGLIIIDEIQRMPDLFPILRVLADRDPSPARFLLLGSASPDLVKKSSETLAGRVEFVHMSGFDQNEVGYDSYKDLWMRGGFPRSFLAENIENSYAWRENFIQTFLERDLGQMGIQVTTQVMQRFWFMLAHYHGQIWNSSEVARSLGVSYMTTQRHLDILTEAYMIRQLQPWFENIGKRQVKSPKIFIRDSGLLHTLIGIKSMSDLQSHPKYGASWEGFVIEQILSTYRDRTCYFWRTHTGAEIDLLLFRNGKRIGFEMKCADAPTMTKSIHIALQDVNLDHLYVIYPGKETYQLHEKVTVTTLHQLNQLLNL